MSSSFSQIVLEDGNLLDYELVPTNMNFMKVPEASTAPKFAVIHDVVRPATTFLLTSSTTSMAPPVDTGPAETMHLDVNKTYFFIDKIPSHLFNNTP